MDRYEDFERTLDPHRADEQAAVAAEVAARLRDRGVTVTGAERPEDLADLLSAVERFEAAVEGHGGDLMVDDLRSPEPDAAPGPRRGGARLHRPHRRRHRAAAAPSATHRLTPKRRSAMNDLRTRRGAVKAHLKE